MSRPSTAITRPLVSQDKPVMSAIIRPDEAAASRSGEAASRVVFGRHGLPEMLPLEAADPPAAASRHVLVIVA